MSMDADDSDDDDAAELAELLALEAALKAEDDAARAAEAEAEEERELEELLRAEAGLKAGEEEQARQAAEGEGGGSGSDVETGLPLSGGGGGGGGRKGWQVAAPPPFHFSAPSVAPLPSVRLRAQAALEPPRPRDRGAAALAQGSQFGMGGGGWDSGERRRFFQALRRCGRDPARVAERVGTKTKLQVQLFLAALDEASALVAAEERDTTAESAAGAGEQAPKKRARRGGARRVPDDGGCLLRGWGSSGFSDQELFDLTTFDLDGVMRYTFYKMNHHPLATIDSAALLAVAACLRKSLRSLLEPAVLASVHRLQTRCGFAARQRFKLQLEPADLQQAARCAGYGESAFARWCSTEIPDEPDGYVFAFSTSDTRANGMRLEADDVSIPRCSIVLCGSRGRRSWINVPMGTPPGDAMLEREPNKPADDEWMLTQASLSELASAGSTYISSNPSDARSLANTEPGRTSSEEGVVEGVPLDEGAAQASPPASPEATADGAFAFRWDHASLSVEAPAYFPLLRQTTAAGMELLNVAFMPRDGCIFEPEQGRKVLKAKTGSGHALQLREGELSGLDAESGSNSGVDSGVDVDAVSGADGGSAATADAANAPKLRDSLGCLHTLVQVEIERSIRALRLEHQTATFGVPAESAHVLRVFGEEYARRTLEGAAATAAAALRCFIVAGDVRVVTRRAAQEGGVGCLTVG